MGTRSIFRTLRSGAILALAMGCVYAQEQPNQEDLVQDLLLRIQALEEKIEQLKQAAPQENRPAVPPSHQLDTSDDEAAPAPPTPPAGSWTDRIRLHAYADAEFVRNETPGVPNHYQIGELVLFGTARVSKDVSALAEVVLDTEDTRQVGAVGINVERLLLQYHFSDYLNIGVGQYRTDIGYYSTAYLRGAWFQTAVTTPHLFAFEDDGGILPLHNVGLTVSGKVPSGWLGLHYTAETGNSVTWGSLSAAENAVASHRALNLALAAHPRQIMGLEIGLSAYRDRFLPSPMLNLNRSIWSAHVVYNANRIEFLNEGVISSIWYAPARASGAVSGFYSQLGYRMGSAVVPYFRVEKISVQGSRFFDQLATVIPWRSMYSGGVRYDWKESIALKFELGTEADIGFAHYIRGAAQVAFAF